MKKLLLVFFPFFLFIPSLSYAADDKAKLKDVLKQISAVKTDITQKELKQKSVAVQLKNLKKKIVTLEKKFKDTAKNIKRQKGVLDNLNKEKTSYQKELKEAQKKLSSQINSAYQTDQTSYFKIILGKEKKLGRDLILSYHKYIFKDRLEKMRSINTTLNRLDVNKKKIEKEKNWLERIKRKQADQKKELGKTKKERDKVLGSLKAKIASQNKKLKDLLAAKKNLEKLISKLAAKKKGVASKALKTKFCKNFVWPTKGKVVIHFGSPIEKSSWKWNGVIIRGAKNQSVRAISSGKVVYADKLSGYGLLLIIDHGDGYMSLYGHLSTLKYDLNSKVKAGEVVANMGRRDSDKHELYFAIRYNGKPIDPEKWCK